MNKSLVLVFGLVFTLANSASARDMIIVGQDFPPFNWEENKEVTGGMADILKEVCKELKHNCKFQIHPLARALKMLEDGEVDAVMSLIPNPDRSVYSNFSPEMVLTNMVYMADQKDNVPKMTELKQIAGRTVAAVRGATSAKIAKKHQDELKTANLKEDVDNTALLQKLKNRQYGEKAIIIGAEDVLNFSAEKEKLNLDTVYTIEALTYVTAFGKKKVNAEELAEFTKTINTFKSNGTIKKILAKYKLKPAA